MLPENGRRQVDRSNAGQHVGHKIEVVEGGRIAMQRHLVIRTTVDVMKQRRGQPLFRQGPEISCIVAISQSHQMPFYADIERDLTTRMLCSAMRTDK